MPARAFQDNPEPFKAIQRYLNLSKTVQNNPEHLNGLEQSKSFEIILKFQLGVSPRKTAQNDVFKAIQPSELPRQPRAIHTHPAPEASKTIKNIPQLESPWDCLCMSDAI